jgi:hypothetical protein
MVARSPPSLPPAIAPLLVLVLVLVLALAAALALASSWRRRGRRNERFEAPAAPVVTPGVEAESDWASCAMPNGAYRFKSEGLAQHIYSSAEKPRCVMSHDGMSLIDASCKPVASITDQVKWTNPLAAALRSKDVFKQIFRGGVNGIPRCIVHLADDASESAAAALDAELMKASAELRSRKPWIIKDYEDKVKALEAEKIAAETQLAAAKDELTRLENLLTTKTNELTTLEAERLLEEAASSLCTSTTLPAKQSSVADATKALAKCQADLGAVPSAADSVETAFGTVKRALNDAPFANVTAGCLVGKAEYLAAHPDVNVDAWQHFTAAGAAGGTWPGGDRCDVVVPTAPRKAMERRVAAAPPPPRAVEAPAAAAPAPMPALATVAGPARSFPEMCQSLNFNNQYMSGNVMAQSAAGCPKLCGTTPDRKWFNGAWTTVPNVGTACQCCTIEQKKAFDLGAYNTSSAWSAESFADKTAKWVWSEKGAMDSAAAGCTKFIKVHASPSDTPATLHIIVDNSAKITLNGQPVGEATGGFGRNDGGRGPTKLPVQLVKGTNTLEVSATNMPHNGGKNPAGLLLSVITPNGAVAFHTDDSWIWGSCGAGATAPSFAARPAPPSAPPPARPSAVKDTIKS